jgi:hypothetical protein
VKKRSSTERPVPENLERGPVMLNDIVHPCFERHRPRVGTQGRERNEPGSLCSPVVCNDASSSVDTRPPRTSNMTIGRHRRAARRRGLEFGEDQADGSATVK